MCELLVKDNIHKKKEKPLPQCLYTLQLHNVGKKNSIEKYRSPESQLIRERIKSSEWPCEHASLLFGMRSPSDILRNSNTRMAFSPPFRIIDGGAANEERAPPAYHTGMEGIYNPD
ncbi:hypothetical protein GWI33_002803 [Rhynchophorus ferrugineus]|uniref:Uncharacterized protein n=1 Tax=Rhynchophorus ferrugineus TaxID=354439 RepID=A0A834IV86_RHYFE|nr:hypothetical protein GWI33_002803 [Rhynchophorus ferrugineus]